MWHEDPRACSHFNNDACPTCDFDGWYRGCVHAWLDRPESDSRECMKCGEEVFG